MKIFISWSGELSRQVGRALHEWLPQVMHSIEPYLSSENISIGRNWVADIFQEIDTSSFGIICVTQESLKSQWLYFEAGALAKSVMRDAKVRICPFLFGVSPNELKEPLRFFQHFSYSEDDIRKLIKSIFESSEDSNLNLQRIETSFQVWWPHLKDKLDVLYDQADKSIIWALEDGDTLSEHDRNLLESEGHRKQVTWNTSEDRSLSDHDVKLMIYVFQDSNSSSSILNKIINLLRDSGGNIPLLVYTAGERRLSKDQMSTLQAYPGYAIANMPQTLKMHTANLLRDAMTIS